MSSKARKKLDEYVLETAGPFDLAVVLLGYTRNTPDNESEQLHAIEGVLRRWREIQQSKAAPDLEAKLRRAVACCQEVGGELTKLAEELDGKT